MSLPPRSKRFVVVDYHTGQVVWRGRSEVECACRWKRGMVYGKGETFKEAAAMASLNAARARAARQLLSELGLDN